MQVQQSNSGPAWYRTRTITVKLNTGETLTGSPVEVTSIGDIPTAPKDRRNFEIRPQNAALYPVACGGEITEVEFDGVRYRVFNLSVGAGRAVLHSEPIGSVPVAANKPPVQEQIVEALRAAPDGLTAKQIGETLECSQRWVFTALASLMKAKRVAKDDGGRYRGCD